MKTRKRMDWNSVVMKFYTDKLLKARKRKRKRNKAQNNTLHIQEQKGLHFLNFLFPESTSKSCASKISQNYNNIPREVERIKISRNCKVKKKVTHTLLESEISSRIRKWIRNHLTFQEKGRKGWVKLEKSICILSVKSKSKISANPKKLV